MPTRRVPSFGRLARRRAMVPLRGNGWTIHGTVVKLTGSVKDGFTTMPQLEYGCAERHASSPSR